MAAENSDKVEQFNAEVRRMAKSVAIFIGDVKESAEFCAANCGWDGWTGWDLWPT